MGNWRINLILAFFILFSTVIAGRLYFLQVARNDFYKALAEGLFNSSDSAKNDRGSIFLKNKEPLAISKDFSFVFAEPAKLENPEKTAEVLSQILKQPEAQIFELLGKDALFALIKNKISDEQAKNISEANLAGIGISQEKLRYYPQESLASQVVGFVDADFQGRYGLEEYYNEELADSSLDLTIDYNIQFQAEKLLKDAKENLKIEGGLILILEPSSGKIVSLANFPNFDPNKYKEYAKSGDLGVFQNAATQKIFEPGSVFKAITMASALDAGRLTPQTKYVDKGEVKIGGRTVYNYDLRTYGEQTMAGVLEKSINTGAVFAEQQLGHNLFSKYIEKFGFFEKTGVDLPEVYSENREFKKGYEINFATASFGQGIEMTPIQLVRAYSALANGGRLVRPFLKEADEPQLSLPVISAKTSFQITAMLTGVVENGFSKKAQVKGYNIAGKTGTAQIAYSALGIPKSGYSDKTVQSFIGYFPAFSPKFLILVKLDNPQTKTAEYSAVPIFQELAEYIINLYQIPPDKQ